MAFTVDGPWALNEDAIWSAYDGIPPERFGSVSIRLGAEPASSDPLVRELHYNLYVLTEEQCRDLFRVHPSIIGNDVRGGLQ